MARNYIEKELEEHRLNARAPGSTRWEVREVFIFQNKEEDYPLGNQILRGRLHRCRNFGMFEETRELVAADSKIKGPKLGETPDT